ncbi:MAG: hypothetical protein OEM62_11105 [Acidobacteriota bacterium]|nr:hypothetical protein [Acidobacteriota bacterium]
MRSTRGIRKFPRGFLAGCFSAALIAAVGCSSLSPSAPSPPEVRTPPRANVQPTVETDDRHWRYALVIDASSSASAMQIYQWHPRGGDRLPRIEAAPFPRNAERQAWELKVKPGLGDYGGRPDDAARSLAPLIDFALEKIGSDPATLAMTSLFLRATAGMRLLPPAEQEEIIASIRRSFADLPFASSSARVISGHEEGTYGWIGANYLLGHLEHGGAFPTVGALDLGGASTQITFVPLDYPLKHGQAVTIGTNTYHLYTYSYLGLGQDQARAHVDSDACFIRGYPLADGGFGTGDFDACRTAIRETFTAPCDEGPCSLFGTYQPPLYGDFLASSVYAYAADFFDLGQRLEPQALAAKGTAFCSQDWNAMVAADPGVADNPYLPTYCYAAAHITTLLTDGFGFSDTTERITAPLRVQGSSVGWALGALVYELAGDGD